MPDFFIYLLEQYGYFAVFLLAFIDHTGIPGGLLLSIGVASTGYLDIYAVFLLSFLGGLVGDLVFYLLGFYGGRKILKRFSTDRKTLSEKVEKASSFFKKQGNIAVVFGRFPAFIGKYVMALAGVFSFPLYKFFILSVVGGLLMIIVYGLPYYLMGNKLNYIFENKMLALYLTLILLVLHLFISWILVLLKRRKGK